MVDVKQALVDVKQASVNLKQASVDVKQASVNIKQASVDVKQASVDVKQPLADVKQASVNLKQASVDVKQPLVNVKQPLSNNSQSSDNPRQKETNMATRPMHSITAQIAEAHQILSNSLAVAEILALVTPFSYDADKLNEGLALVTAAQEASEQHTVMAGAQKSATQEFLAAQSAARDAYQALSKVARAVYVRDPAQRTALGLDGVAPKHTFSFLTRAFTLFDNAANLSALSTYGYDAAKLASERAKVAAMRAADNAQEIAKGKALQATADQKSALAAMNEWVAQYRKVAKVALRGRKQLLEQIGVTARSSKTAAQRAAPAKAAATRAAKKEQG